MGELPEKEDGGGWEDDFVAKRHMLRASGSVNDPLMAAVVPLSSIYIIILTVVDYLR